MTPPACSPESSELPIAVPIHPGRLAFTPPFYSRQAGLQGSYTPGLVPPPEQVQAGLRHRTVYLWGWVLSMVLHCQCLGLGLGGGIWTCTISVGPPAPICKMSGYVRRPTPPQGFLALMIIWMSRLLLTALPALYKREPPKSQN